jgi:hypothetical protein
MPWNLESRSAPRSVISPERARQRRGLRAAVALLTAACVVSACSRNAHSVRLPGLSPRDEIYRISCEDTIAHCRDEASEVCTGRYRVLETEGAPVEPVRVSSAPGPSSTGPRYQRVKWIGQMVVACGDATSELTREGDAPVVSDRAAAVAAPAPAQPRADRLCIPGVTQECLGPAACRGAQACLSDGNGYGRCDCGDAVRPPSDADAGTSPRH